MGFAAMRRGRLLPASFFLARDMKRLFLMATAALCVGLCHAQPPVPSTRNPANILAERSHSLGAEFRLVEREVANPAGHWEGVGHFSYVYFRDRELCQCSSAGVSISPSGRFAALQDGPTGKLLLFSVRLNRIVEITKDYIGSADTFAWDEPSGRLTVKFFQGLAPANKNVPPISVALP